MKHIFLVGAKSLGAYGGYETFVDKLTEYHQNEARLKYHVAVKANGQGCMNPCETQGVEMTSSTTFTYHNAECFMIKVPEYLGPAQAIYYDIKSLQKCCEIVKKSQSSKSGNGSQSGEPIRNFTVYVLACRVGIFFNKYVKMIHKLGGKVYLNPDGHEWKRGKWSAPVRLYWKLSEKLMVKHSDLVICDSVHIEKYIKRIYDKYQPQTTYIAYGTEIRKSIGAEGRYQEWLHKNQIKENEYYLVVGRFVPENNYETIIREFMHSNTKKDLVIISNIQADSRFMKKLEKKFHFANDSRIKFVGTVYDKELLMKIREEAYAYIHGHEVGGTNPSLIEALGSTKLNLLLDVDFNKEVALETALYWRCKQGDLTKLIDQVNIMNTKERLALGIKAKERVKTAYSWQLICDKYAEIF